MSDPQPEPRHLSKLGCSGAIMLAPGLCSLFELLPTGDLPRWSTTHCGFPVSLWVLSASLLSLWLSGVGAGGDRPIASATTCLTPCNGPRRRRGRFRRRACRGMREARSPVPSPLSVLSPVVRKISRA
jgi:hypothetical protein